MKMLLMILSFPLLSSAATWSTGDYKIDLTKDSRGDWVSSGCEKSCPLIQTAKDYIQKNPLPAEELAGGKHPGSVICKKINGKIIYLRNESSDEAFCELDKNTVSLSKLIQFLD